MPRSLHFLLLFAFFFWCFLSFFVVFLKTPMSFPPWNLRVLRVVLLRK